MTPSHAAGALWPALVSFVLGAAAPAAHTEEAPALPPSYSAEYTLSGYGTVIGRSLWRLTVDEAGEAVLEQRTWPEGLAKLLIGQTIEERTQLEMHGSDPRPAHYSYRREGKKPRSSDLRFDWGAMRVEGERKGEAVSMAIAPGTHDKMSYVLALISELSTGGTKLRYQVTDGRKTKTYAFSDPKPAEIDTVLGKLAVVELTRLREGGERETTYWLAPSLNYIPVQIEHKEKTGEHVVARIEKLSWKE